MVFTTSPAKRIRKAIGSLLATNRFFGVLSLRMNAQPGNVDTIAGNGILLTYSEEWVAEAGHDEIKGAIAHIVYGCALKHHIRRGERDSDRWNRASRIVTAELLRREDIWVPDDVRGRDLPIEVVYDQLPETPGGGGGPQAQPGAGQGQGQDQGQGQGQGGQQGNGGGSPDPGEIQDAPEDQQDQQDRSWDQASKQAIQLSKSAGDQAGNIQQVFEGQHVHRRDWQDILLEYMRSAAPTDYSWGVPNRRFIDQGIYLPSLRGQGMGPIVIAIDTSGSVDDAHVNQALTEMFAIARDVNPERIHLLQCDTRITEARDFDPADAPHDITIKGRGGTRLDPVFEYVLEHDIRPEVLIYLTDLEAVMPAEPDYPVIWAVETSAQAERAPFGQSLVVPQEAA